MSFLNSVTSALLSGASQAQVQSKLLPALVQVINGFPGGLGGLIERLRQGGLADVVSSWLSAEPAQAVEPAQLRTAFGIEAIGDLVQKSGLDEKVVLDNLKNILPALISKSGVGGALNPDQPLDIKTVLASVGQLLGNKA